jgi:hypothetical protein
VLMTHTAPREWAKPVESELWEAIEALDEAKLAIVACLREQNPPDENLTRFSEEFDRTREGLQKVMLDALSPETDDLDET